MTLDPIQQTLERLQQVSSSTAPTTAAYTILVESSASLAVRQALTQVDDDTSLYRQAGLRTPAENSHLDWYGAQPWWHRLVAQLSVASSSTKNINPRNVIHLQTIPGSCRRRTKSKGQQQQQEPFIIDLTIDPWGWESDDDGDNKQDTNDDETVVVGMNSLQGIINAIQARLQQQQSTISSTALVVDSLTPLWVRHGTTKVISFLQCLQQLEGISMILLQATTTTITDTHQNNVWIRALEDRANALLLLQRGQALWMHQGVRERDNMIRQTMEFTVQRNEQQVQETVDTIRLVEKTEAVPKEQHHESIPENETAIDPNVPPPFGAPAASGRGRPRVKLQLEEENGPPKRPPPPASSLATPPATTTASLSLSGPRIFMQADDKEFEDYDEEDPDDDLDI
eukprot:scaffold26_cov158-Amphora_coffeaeformis.AAC.4